MIRIFFKRKMVYRPTVWGWSVIIFVLFIALWFLFNHTYSFLAKNEKGNARILVVEGWIPEHALRNAIEYYYDNHYEYMIVTGVPITQWTFSSPFSNMAEASVESMKRLFFKDTIYTATIPNTVLRDRTYSTAVSLKMEMEKWQLPYDEFDIYTMGAHARRTHLMYKKVFGRRMPIGLVADTDPSFEPQNWYRTSRGFRIVFSELISYFYSALFFYPDIEKYKQNIVYGRYYDQITSDRYEKDRYFSDSLTSPLNDTALAYFRGLRYFLPDKDFKIKALLKRNAKPETITMPTTTEREPRYLTYGRLQFEVSGQIQELTAFLNLDMLESNPDFSSLFVPFKDLTNGTQTYGGGRYLDIQLPDNDSLIIDFNRSYNPFCVYDDRWSCPLTPFENYLDVHILAGEKKYP